MIKENYAYIEGDFGRYHRIKLIHKNLDPNEKLKLITYYSGENNIVFVFQWDKKPYFFLKKTIDELKNFDTSNERVESKCLIQAYSNVFYLENPHNVKRI